MTAFAPDSLLAQLNDPRSGHGHRYSLTCLLASACAAILCGQTSYAAISDPARPTFTPAPPGTPSPRPAGARPPVPPGASP